MKFNLSAEELQQGRINQNKSKETPNTFATGGGAAQVNPTDNLAKGDVRKAGAEGERALQMMNDPNEKQRTANWMNAFNMSPAAMQNGWVMPPAPAEESAGGKEAKEGPQPE